jgi:hypothetical protein
VCGHAGPRAPAALPVCAVVVLRAPLMAAPYRRARSKEVAARLKEHEVLVNAIAMRLQKEMRMKAREAVKLAGDIAANGSLAAVNVMVRLGAVFLCPP